MNFPLEMWWKKYKILLAFLALMHGVGDLLDPSGSLLIHNILSGTYHYGKDSSLPR